MNGSAHDVEVSILVFQAPGWYEARDKAVDLGRAQEASYLNVYGELVEWRLTEVTTLDSLGGDPLPGEVYSYFDQVREQDHSAGSQLPENSEPQSSGVGPAEANRDSPFVRLTENG